MYWYSITKEDAEKYAVRIFYAHGKQFSPIWDFQSASILQTNIQCGASRIQTFHDFEQKKKSFKFFFAVLMLGAGTGAGIRVPIFFLS